MDSLNKENIKLTDKELANVNGGSHIILPGGSDDALKPTPGTGTVLKPVRTPSPSDPKATGTSK